MGERDPRPSPPRRSDRRDYNDKPSRWDDRAAPSHRHREHGRDSSPRRRQADDGWPDRSSRRRHDDDAAARYGEHNGGRERDAARYPDRDGSSSGRYAHNDNRSSSGPRRTDFQPHDFERDRRRERAAYDASAASRAGLSRDGPAHSDGPGDDPAVKAANLAPDFGSSGLLAAASNSKDGIALKYHEPPEARKPKPGKGWRLYVFKDGKDVDLIHMTRQSCYLFGRERRVVDILLEHPSASKQHAVIQFRQVTERNEFGDEKREIRPFLIDLESSNGSYVNGTEVPTSRYVELKSGDTLKFGTSTREWVLLPEDAA